MPPSISVGSTTRLAVLVVVLSSCGHNFEARDAKEFVEKYTSAWKQGDVDAIVSMQFDMKKFDISRIPPGKALELVNAGQKNARQEVESDIRAKGFIYRLSTDLTYVSEENHGDHIHVRVAQGAARTDIVLVRDGELLKIFPFPSWFD